MGFAAGGRAGDATSDGEDFDTALAALLDGPAESPEAPEDSGDSPADDDTGTAAEPDDHSR
jgi:hypothetical protein